MELSFLDREKFEQWRYNLALLAPTKGESKGTVSKGLIRIEFGNGWYQGWVTDDILFATTRVLTDPINIEWEPEVVHTTPQALMAAEVVEVLGGGFAASLSESEPIDPEFDKLFWVEHVDSVIDGPCDPAEMSFTRLSPDKLRKFSLLKPRGGPLDLWWVEWADQTLIRWVYEDVWGVYVPSDKPRGEW